MRNIKQNEHDITYPFRKFIKKLQRKLKTELINIYILDFKKVSFMTNTFLKSNIIFC